MVMIFLEIAYINSNVTSKQREQIIIPIEFEVGTTSSSGIGPGIADGLQKDGNMDDIYQQAVDKFGSIYTVGATRE
jgi:hypothetical protein